MVLPLVPPTTAKAVPATKATAWWLPAGGGPPEVTVVTAVAFSGKYSTTVPVWVPSGLWPPKTTTRAMPGTYTALPGGGVVRFRTVVQLWTAASSRLPSDRSRRPLLLEKEPLPTQRL